MKPDRLKTLFTVLMLTAMFCVQAEAQKLRPAIKNKAASAPKRTYEPVVLGRSHSFVIEGRIAAAGRGRIEIKTALGSRYQFEADDQTMYLQSGGLVSISTLPDVSLRFSDLRAADRVEIVAEREGQRIIAKIVTRIGGGGK